MQEFFLGVLGSLIGAGATAFVGYRAWQLQRKHDTRLEILRAACHDFAELCRLSSGASSDPSALQACVLRLQSNVAMTDVFFGHEVSQKFLKAIDGIAGRAIVGEQREAMTTFLNEMSAKLK